MGFIRNSFFKKFRTKRIYETFDYKSVVKKVPFGDKLVEVTTFEPCEPRHPIPASIKVNMFTVANQPKAELVKQPLFSANQTDEIYNGYLRLQESVERLRAQRAASAAPAPAPASAAPATTE